MLMPCGTSYYYSCSLLVSYYYSHPSHTAAQSAIDVAIHCIDASQTCELRCICHLLQSSWLTVDFYDKHSEVTRKRLLGEFQGQDLTCYDDSTGTASKVQKDQEPSARSTEECSCMLLVLVLVLVWPTLLMATG